MASREAASLPTGGQPPEGQASPGGQFDPFPGWKEEAELRAGGFGQWRQLREQATALAPEVAELRKQVDEGTAVLRAELERERAARHLLEKKLSSQDEVLTMLREKIPEGGQNHSSSTSSGGLPSFLKEVRESFGRELKDCAAGQRRLEQRLSELHDVVGAQEGGLSVLVQRLSRELVQEVSIREKETLELREELGGEVHAREKHREQVKEMMKRHAPPEEAPEVAQAYEVTLRAFESRLAEQANWAREQQATQQERIRAVERLLSESADSHTRDLEAVHTKLQDKLNGRLWEFHGSLRDLYCELKERVERMEEARSAEGAAGFEARGRHVSDADPKRVNDLEALIRETRQAHEQELAAFAKERGEYHSMVQERFQQLEALHGKAAGRHAQDLEEAHSKIAEEVEARDVNQMSLKKRVDVFEKTFKDSLHDYAGKTAEELHCAISALRGEFQDRLARAQEEHAQRLQEHGKHASDVHGKACAQLHTHLDDEREARETHEAWVKDNLASEREVRMQHERAVGSHLGALEQRLGQEMARLRDDLDAHRQTWTEHNDSILGQLQKERGAREMHERSVHNLTAEERKAREAHEMHIKEFVDSHWQAHQEQYGSLHGHFATEKEKREAHEAQLAYVHDRLAHLGRLMGDAEGHGGHGLQGHAQEGLIPLRERLVALEQRLDDHTDKHTEQLQAAHAAVANEQQARGALHQTLAQRIDGLEQQQHDALSAQGPALETVLQRHLQSLADSHASELSAGLQSLHAEFQSRLEEEREARQQHHAASREELARETGAISAGHSSLHDRLSALEKRHGEDVATLTEELRGAPQASFYDSVREHLASEKKARESHERLMQSHASQERQSRELHTTSVQEHLMQERQAREKQHEHIQQLMQQTVSHEASQKSLQELMSQERARIQEVLGKERECLQDLVANEKAERTRHHAAVSARVDSLQRTLDIFDTIVRKEISERSEEGRRMRTALDEISQAPAVSGVEESDRRASLQCTAPCRSTAEPVAACTEQEVPPPLTLPSAPERRVGAAYVTKPVALGMTSPCGGPSPPSAPRPVIPVTTSGSYCASPQRGISAPLRSSNAGPPPQVIIATSGYSSTSPALGLGSRGTATAGSHTPVPSPPPGAALASSASATELRPATPTAAATTTISGRPATTASQGSPPPRVSLRHSASSGTLPVPPVSGLSAVHVPAGGSYCTTPVGSWQPPPVRTAQPPSQRATVPLVVPPSGRSLSHSPSARDRLPGTGGKPERLPARELQHWGPPMAELVSQTAHDNEKSGEEEASRCFTYGHRPLAPPSLLPMSDP